MSFRTCTVSFVERGQRHTARVDAESAFEAAALALKYFEHQRLRGPSRHAVLELEIEAPRRLTLKVSDVLTWLYEKPGQTPEQAARKKRLRDLLADNGH